MYKRGLDEKWMTHSSCKSCHNPPRKIQPKGFQLLPEEQQQRIIKALLDRRIKVKTIAEQEGVTYANLSGWIRRGKIPLLG